jgi:hypothetical protein
MGNVFKEMLVILAGDVLGDERSQKKHLPKAMPLEGFIFACSWNNAPFRCNAMPTLHRVVAMLQAGTLHKTSTPKCMAPLRGFSTVPLVTLAKKNLLNHFKDF